jgi:hypothetical protein
MSQTGFITPSFFLARKGNLTPSFCLRAEFALTGAISIKGAVSGNDEGGSEALPRAFWAWRAVTLQSYPEAEVANRTARARETAQC